MNSFIGTQRNMLVYITVVLIISQNVQAQTTGPQCTTTGHRCINLDGCAGLANAQYQYCGDCKHYVSCQGGVGTLIKHWDENYQNWDDNRKSFEVQSTTCVECYYECPEGPSAPSEQVCGRTGLGCVNTTCPGNVNGNFQYCGNCYQFVQCQNPGAGYTLQNCPSDTVFDDTPSARTCRPISSTCRECYDTCYPPTTTPEPTTQGPLVTGDDSGGNGTTTNPGGPGGSAGNNRITLPGSFLFCFISTLVMIRAVL